MFQSACIAQGMSAAEAAQTLIQIRDKCNIYVQNGEQFWRGSFKKAEDAPGLVLLNSEIQKQAKKSRRLDAVKEIAWQKCLDVVFNNQKSKDNL